MGVHICALDPPWHLSQPPRPTQWMIGLPWPTLATVKLNHPATFMTHPYHHKTLAPFATYPPSWPTPNISKLKLTTAKPTFVLLPLPSWNQIFPNLVSLTLSWSVFSFFFWFIYLGWNFLNIFLFVSWESNRKCVIWSIFKNTTNIFLRNFENAIKYLKLYYAWKIFLSWRLLFYAWK